MSARYPGGNPNPFSASEIDGLDLAPDEVAADGRLARELKSVADRGTVRPSPDFADRVMSAIADEPTPAPVIAAGSAVRRLSLVGVATSVRDSVRVAFGHGFPAAARAQGVALMLVAALVVGTAGVAAAGAVGLLGSDDHHSGPTAIPATPAPTPSQVVEPTPPPTPSESTGPDGTSPSPSRSVTPTETESPDPSDSAEPRETQEPGDAGGSGTSGAGSAGSGSSSSASGDRGSGSTSGGSGDSGGQSTERPEDSSGPEGSQQPGEDGGRDHGGSSPSPVAASSVAPQPSPTQEP